MAQGRAASSATNSSVLIPRAGQRSGSASPAAWRPHHTWRSAPRPADRRPTGSMPGTGFSSAPAASGNCRTSCFEQEAGGCCCCPPLYPSHEHSHNASHQRRHGTTISHVLARHRRAPLPVSFVGPPRSSPTPELASCPSASTTGRIADRKPLLSDSPTRRPGTAPITKPKNPQNEPPSLDQLCRFSSAAYRWRPQAHRPQRSAGIDLERGLCRWAELCTPLFNDVHQH